jgi:hypothetical protein
MYYVILHKYDYDWKAQDLVFTKSKALFDAVKLESITPELVEDLNAWNTLQEEQYELPTNLIEAIEWLQDYRPTLPLTILDYTEFYDL